MPFGTISNLNSIDLFDISLGRKNVLIFGSPSGLFKRLLQSILLVVLSLISAKNLAVPLMEFGK